MSDRPANFELSFLLPLGVIANQLLKVEADLRFLNARTSIYADQGPRDAVAGQVASQLEKINETLEAIRGLVSAIEADIHPRPKNANSLKGRTDRDD